MAEASLNLRVASLSDSPLDEMTGSARAQACAPAPAVAFLREPAQLQAIADDWRRLESDSAAPRSVFQSSGWITNWAQSYAGEGDLVVVTVRRNGRLTFAWPLMAVPRGPVTVLEWLTQPFSQYGDMLLARDENLSEVMDAALEAVRAARIADSIRLRHVRCDAAIAPWLPDHFGDARFTVHAPFLDLTAFADETAYDARYSATQRKRRKKIRKSLEDDFGPLRFTLLRSDSGSGEIEAAIDSAISEKSAWIEERGRHNRILRCPRLGGFLKRLCRSAVPGCELVVSELRAGGCPASWEIGLRANGVHYAFITSHMAALTDYSVARLHMDLSQRQALKDGMRTFDLMLPHDAYKDSWSSAAAAVSDYYLPLNAKGRIYGRLYLEGLRPVLRQSYYSMPPGLLKLLKPVIGH
jgi:CelD/BcsL family acetyltransferase involved in cellulose biosynthesis